jgi:hypothetical protein
MHRLATLVATALAGCTFMEQHLCVDTPLPFTATLYFITFIVIAAFVLLSMYVAVILVSTTEAVFDIEAETKEAQRWKRLRAKADAAAAENSLEQKKRRQFVLSNVLEAWNASDDRSTVAAARSLRMTIDKLGRNGVPLFAPSENLDLEWEESRTMCVVSRGYFLLGMQMLKIKDSIYFIQVRVVLWIERVVLWIERVVLWIERVVLWIERVVLWI